MAKSFRLDPELEQRLKTAAAREAIAASALNPDAVRRRCGEVLGGTLLDELGATVGAVEGGGGQSRRTGRAFSELLRARRVRGSTGSP